MLGLLSTTERIAYHDNGERHALFEAMDYISQQWSPSQASAILPFLASLDDLSYTEVARHLGKSRQAVTKSLDAAAHTTVSHILKSVEGVPFYA